METPLRRLSDKIIAAHKQACDEDRIDVAEALLKALEFDLSAIGGSGSTDKRSSMALLEAAFVRHEEAKEKCASV